MEKRAHDSLPFLRRNGAPLVADCRGARQGSHDTMSEIDFAIGLLAIKDFCSQLSRLTQPAARRDADGVRLPADAPAGHAPAKSTQTHNRAVERVTAAAGSMNASSNRERQ